MRVPHDEYILTRLALASIACPDIIESIKWGTYTSGFDWDYLVCILCGFEEAGDKQYREVGNLAKRNGMLEGGARLNWASVDDEKSPRSKQVCALAQMLVNEGCTDARIRSMCESNDQA